MGKSASIVRSFCVGKRTCTITMQQPRRGVVAMSTVEWEPTVPGRLSKREMRQYRADRDAVVAQAATLIGGRTLIVEM